MAKPAVTASPKKKKEKPIPKSQAAGMGAKDVQTCRNVLKKLVGSKLAYFFRVPVDPVRDHAPGSVLPSFRPVLDPNLPLFRYFEKIAHPMDLGSMAYKLDNGHYPSRDAFRNDFELMITNAKTYNAPGSPVYQEGEKLKAFFEKSAFYFKIHGTISHHTVHSLGSG